MKITLLDDGIPMVKSIKGLSYLQMGNDKSNFVSMIF